MRAKVVIRMAYSTLRTFFPRLFRTKRPFKLTGPGWVFILYTIGVGAGAINTGNNLLYLVFGVFLGLLLASGFLSDLSLWGVDLEPMFPRSSEAGKPMSIFVVLHNTKRWLPSIALNVLIEFELGGRTSSVRIHVPFIAAGRSATARAEWVPAERGWFDARAIRVTTRYPFGLLEKWWRLRFERARDTEAPIGDRDHGFYVTPAIVTADANRLLARTRGDDAITETFERGEGTTLVGLRGYAPGDNPRRIHWKATAKRMSGDAAAPWFVREMEKEQRPEIAFECPSPLELSGLSGSEAERVVQYLASAIGACEEQNIRWSVSIDGKAVIDATAFLSLWNPQVAISDTIARAVGFAPLERAHDSRTTVRVLEEFYAARA